MSHRCLAIVLFLSALIRQLNLSLDFAVVFDLLIYTGSCYVAQAGLEVVILLLNFLSARIAVILYHIFLQHFFFFFFFLIRSLWPRRALWCLMTKICSIWG
jgi:hypothetical protein